MSKSKSKDVLGRTYIKYAALCENTLIELDDGFDCHKAGLARVLLNPEGRAFFYCEAGRHHLDGQADDGIHCIGVYPVPK